jgi:hypothetical protein
MFIGCDVGRFWDETALVGVSISDSRYTLEQITLLNGMDFRQQSKIIARMGQNHQLYVDCTGLGAGLFDLLQPLCNCKPVAIRAGNSCKFHRSGFAAGKQLLMSLIALALPKLSINPQIPAPMRHAFERQLGAMRVTAGKTPKFGAKSGHHDDLVLALALALLGAQFDGQARS